MKKILACVLAASMALSLSAVAFAALNPTDVVDGDGKNIGMASGSYPSLNINSSNGAIFDTITPDQTIYAMIDKYSGGSRSITLGDYTDVAGIPAAYLADNDLFSLSVKDKSGDASKLIKITQEDAKSIDSTRGSWLKIVVGNTMTSDEMKGTMTLEFKPKSKLYEKLAKNLASYTPNSGGPAITDKDDMEDAIKADIDGDKFKYDMTFWVNNEIEDGEDTEREAGDKFVFNPASNEENIITWVDADGDDRAALKFDADDDADKFYAKLSTKSISSMWSEYADPIGADLWFYDFVGATSIPATSRATLTLGIPWNEDDDYAPAPEDCFIYRLGADGELTDVTSSFTYDSDGDIDGWKTRTRELGTFVVSDMELDIDVAGAEEPESSEPATVEPGKVIPNTGSSDMVNVAVVAAVVSLAAAGAVAFRKVK